MAITGRGDEGFLEEVVQQNASDKGGEKELPGQEL